MVYYVVRDRNDLTVSDGFDSMFYSKRKAFEVRDEYVRRTGSQAKVLRVQHVVTEVSR